MCRRVFLGLEGVFGPYVVLCLLVYVVIVFLGTWVAVSRSVVAARGWGALFDLVDALSCF